MARRNDPLVVLVTFPTEEVAARICSQLLGEGRIACANLVPGVRSLYRWRGEVQDDAEVLALLKTTRGALAELETALVAAHPYETPEFVVLSPEHVEKGYLAWLRGAVGEEDAAG